MTNDKKLLIEMNDLLSEKLLLLNDIFKITLKQKSSIADENLEELNKQLLLRQNKINLIDNIDLKFQKIFDHIKKRYHVKSFDEIINLDKEIIHSLKTQISDIDKIVSKIITEENLNKQNANKTLDKLGLKMKQISTSKKTNKAYNYGNSFKEPSYFIDKKK